MSLQLFVWFGISILNWNNNFWSGCFGYQVYQYSTYLGFSYGESAILCLNQAESTRNSHLAIWKWSSLFESVKNRSLKRDLSDHLAPKWYSSNPPTWVHNSPEWNERLWGEMVRNQQSRNDDDDDDDRIGWSNWFLGTHLIFIHPNSQKMQITPSPRNHPLHPWQEKSLWRPETKSTTERIKMPLPQVF